MPKKLNSVIGVDIGSQQIKVAEVKLQGREPAITALAVGPTPANAVDHTGVYDVDGVAAVIKGLIQESGASSSHIVVSIAGQASVLVRTVEVPRMNPTELKEHMQWEISRNIPFAESNVVSDFKAFEPTDPQAVNMDVVMAISPQTAIDTVVDIVKKAGKQPAAIDVEPLAIARSLVSAGGQAQPGETVCVVEVGHKTTSINMYRDGQLLMPRQLPIGGEMFTKALMDNMGMSQEDAENAKATRLTIPDSAGVAGAGNPFGAATQAFASYNPFADDAALIPTSMQDGGGPAPVTNAPAYNPFAEPEEIQPYAPGAPAEDQPPVPEAPAGGFPNPWDDPADVAPPMAETNLPAPAPTQDDEAIRLYNAVAVVLDEFLSEVRRSVDYYRSKGGDVGRILLAGGGSHLGGLDAFLGKTLAMPVAKFDPARGLQLAMKRAEPGLVERRREEFAIAIGNALHICFD